MHTALEARRPGGAIPNTIKLVHAARTAGARLFWTRYEIFRQKYPQSPLDKSQYDHWASSYADWSEADKERDWRPVQEINALIHPDDEIIHYTSLGNVFLGREKLFQRYDFGNNRLAIG